MIDFARPQKFDKPYEVLYLGGPMDGKRESFRQLPAIRQAAERVRRPVAWGAEDFSNRTNYRTVRYHLRRFEVYVEGGYREFFFYAVAGMSDVAIMESLFHGYSAGRGQICNSSRP